MGNEITMLIVEDDTVAAEICARLIALEYPGAAVYLAENGSIGLELFRKHAPQIVITDIDMPVLNGIEMARGIKRLKPDTRFIVLTAYNEQNFVRQFQEIGVETYLLKPLNMDHLLSAIDTCIEEIRAAGSLPR